MQTNFLSLVNLTPGAGSWRKA